MIITSMIVASSILFGSPSTAMAAKQRVNFFIGGECSENFEYYEEYALYEDDFDSCYFSIRVTKPSVKRTMRVQYFDEDLGEWVTENSARTNKRGNATVFVEDYCGIDYDTYCDGTWAFRVLVPRKGSEKTKTSEEVNISFYPSYL
jgi:hypothetical protein